MTWWTKERMDTALWLVTEGCIVVSGHMLIFILSMSVKALEMLCVQAANALAPRAGDLSLAIAESIASNVCLTLLNYVSLL